MKTLPCTPNSPGLRGALRAGLGLALLGLLAVGATLLWLSRDSGDGDAEGGDERAIAAPEIPTETARRAEEPAQLAPTAKPVVADEKPTVSRQPDFGRLFGGRTSLFGTITASGAPVGEFTVRVQEGEVTSLHPKDWKKATSTLYQNPRGVFRMGLWDPGTYTALVEAVGYEPRITRFQMPLDDRGLQVSLDAGRAVYGTILDSRGLPARGVDVSLVPLGGRATREETTTDHEGSYAFSGFDGGDWYVELSSFAGLAEPPRSETLALREEAAQATWDHTLPAMSAVEVQIAFSRRPMGKLVATLHGKGGARLETRLQGGRASFPYVAAGLYDLYVGLVDQPAWLYETIEVPDSRQTVRFEREIETPAQERRNFEAPSEADRERLLEERRRRAGARGRGRRG